MEVVQIKNTRFEDLLNGVVTNLTLLS